MRILFIILLSFLSLFIKGQTIQYLGGPSTQIYIRGQLRVDTVIYLPLTDTLFTPSQKGALIMKSSNNVLYVWNGTFWNTIPVGSTAWGQITGNINSQTDLINMFAAYQPLITAGYGIKKTGNTLAFDSANVRKVDTLFRINDSTLQYNINGKSYTVLLRGTAAGGISSLVLHTDGVIYSNPVNFTNTGGAWSGTMTLNNQSAGAFFAGPITGSPATPTFRAMATSDLPTGIPNGNLQNSTINLLVGTSGTSPTWSTSPVALGGTTTLNIPQAITSGVTLGGISNTDYNAFLSKEPAITPSNTVNQYWNGYKQFVPLNSDSIHEGSSNLFYTNARARAALSLTTTGTSGAATYNNSTGIFNIPQYQGALSLTTTGTGGPSTLVGNTLNVPNYAPGLGQIYGTQGIRVNGGDTAVLDSVWKRQGVVMTASQIGDLNNVQEPTVLRDTGSLLLGRPHTDTIFKMWYTQGWNTIATCYAESLDGFTWTKYSGNPIISNHCRNSVIHIGGQYILFAVPGITGPQIDRYISTNGRDFTLSNAAVIVQGTSGTWNGGGVFNSWSIFENDSLKMIVDGLGPTVYSDGLYYSADTGKTFTQYSSNPVIPNGTSAVWFTKRGNTYWLWGHSAGAGFFTPTDFYRDSSDDLIHWTQNPIQSTFHRLTFDEGVDSSNGQVGDICMVPMSNKVYMFHDATPNGNAQGSTVPGLQIKLNIFSGSIDSLVTTRENANRFQFWETNKYHMYFLNGNVGIKVVQPAFPLHVVGTTLSTLGLFGYNPGGAFELGYNTYYNGTSLVNYDTTKNGMGWQMSPAESAIWTVSSGTSPTRAKLGGWDYTNGMFFTSNHAIIGNTSDNGLGQSLQVTGGVWVNGNTDLLGYINHLYLTRGGGSSPTNIQLSDNSALSSNTTGQYNLGLMPGALNSNTTGSYNIAVGSSTLTSNTAGSYNSAFGDISLLNNTGNGNSAFGRVSGYSNTIGTYNAYLGYAAGYSDGTNVTLGNLNYSSALGAYAQVRCSNCLALGGMGTYATKVGIALDSPTHYLHVNGDAYITDSLSLAQTRLGVVTDSVLVKHGTAIRAIGSNSFLQNGVTNNLTANTTIAAGSNQFTVSGSTGTAQGLFVNSSLFYGAPGISDANLTIGGGWPLYSLPLITANRTITLPSAISDAGRIIKIMTPNQTSFKWSFASTVEKQDATVVTDLLPSATYTLQAISNVWFIVSIQQGYDLLKYKHTIFTPSTGNTITALNGYENIINPSGTIAALTIALPSSPIDGDVVNFTSTQIITAITYSGGTVVGGILSTTVGQQWHLTYDAGTTTWY